MGLLWVFSISGKQQFSSKPLNSVNYVKKQFPKILWISLEMFHILKLASSARHLEVSTDKHFIQKI